VTPLKTLRPSSFDTRGGCSPASGPGWSVVGTGGTTNTKGMDMKKGTDGVKVGRYMGSCPHCGLMLMTKDWVTVERGGMSDLVFKCPRCEKTATNTDNGGQCESAGCCHVLRHSPALLTDVHPW